MSRSDRDRWDARYRDRQAGEPPAASLLSLQDHVPTTGTALDVGGGAGRNSIWLAGRGLDVTLLDVSTVGARLAAKTAAAAGLGLTTVVRDLDYEALPSGPFDLIIDTYFLFRPLFEQFADCLSDQGTLIFIHPTRTNLVKNDRPPARFLLDDGEIPSLVEDTGLEVVHYFEGWTPDDRHEAQLVARKA